MARVSTETKAATRGRLLDTAAEEFGRAGYERASIDAISLAAGFAKGTVYNYFSSKEELFLAVVEEATRQAIAGADGSPGASARDRLEHAIAAFCAWAQENEAFARVLVRECLMGTPSLYPRVTLAETPLLETLERIIDEGARKDEVRDDLPADLLALALAGLVDLALARHWATGQPAINGIPELAVRLLLGPFPGDAR